MPKNNVSDHITDQEIAFARLVLSGTMTDRDAAQAAGLNPDTAAYTKAKPRVRAYMTEHRASVQQQLVGQEADRQRRKEHRREQVLDRLWEISIMAPEMTRGSITGQVKALSMIVAIEGLIPDRRVGSAENKPALPPAWLPPKHEKNLDHRPDSALGQEEADPGLTEPDTTLGSAGGAPPPTYPTSSPSDFAFASRVLSSEAHVPAFFSAPDTRSPFSTKNNPFTHRR